MTLWQKPAGLLMAGLWRVLRVAALPAFETPLSQSFFWHFEMTEL